MKVLGIDPSLVKTGWGVVRFNGNEILHIDHGVMKPKTTLPIEKRLAILYDECQTLFNIHRPDAVCIEDTYCGVNPRTTIRLGLASGAIISAFGCLGSLVFQYSTKIIKQTITHKGSADKYQVHSDLCSLFQMEIKNLDASDALATAVTHVMQMEQLNSTKSQINQKSY